MEYRHLGASGFKVPVLSFGTGTFGGKGEFFQAWGATDVAEARRLIDICFDAGVTMFDTADIYSSGASEAVLGEALKGKRERAIISTKATFRFDNESPNNVGSSRFHLIQAVDASLKRLQTDYIDVYFSHDDDTETPLAETLGAYQKLIEAGKVRVIGASNYSGARIREALAVSRQHGLPEYQIIQPE